MNWRGTLLVAVAAVGLVACGSHTATPPPPPPQAANNPVPAIASLSPASAAVGAAAQTLTINGSGFMSSSTVSYDGTAHTATFVSAAELTINLSTTDQATAGSYPVAVTNPAPGGGTSNSVNFKVLAPAPAATSLSPAVVLLNSTPGTVTITGTNFDPKATVTFAGTAANSVTVVSATQITFATTAAELASAAIDAVVITNPDGQTATINFTVDNPAPTITSVQPQPVYPCDAPGTLTVTGTNFLAGTTVSYNGESKTATIRSATQLTIPLTLADTATPGNYALAVTLGGPGGGTATQNFVVSVPTGATLSGTGPESSSLIVYTEQPGTGMLSGTAVCTSATDATGAFKVTLDTPTASPLDVTTAGGTIHFIGASLQALTAPPLDALLDSAPGNTTVSGIDVGMFGEFAYQLAVSNYIQGKDATLTAAHADATKLLDGFYHFSGATAIELIPPGGNDAALEMEAEQGVLNEGVELGWKNPADLIGAMASDISDGVWNGGVNYSGEPALLATAGTSDYLDAAINWAQSSAGQAALQNAPSAELVAGAAACTCTPDAIGLDQTSSSALVHLAFNGHQYVYEGFGQGVGGNGVAQIAVFDVTDPTAALQPPKIWKTQDAYWGLVGMIGAADHPQIFAYDGLTATVTLFDAEKLATGNPATDPLPTDDPPMQLSFKNLPTQIISASSGLFITSAEWDGCALGCRVVLASVDGYTFFNPATDALDESQAYATGSNQDLTESLGAALTRGIPVTGAATATSPVAVAGNYDGVQLVDFGAKTSYDLSVATLGSDFPEMGVGGDFVDGNAVDSIYDVAVLAQEGGTNNPIGFLNLDGILESGGVLTPGNPPAAETQIGTPAALSLGGVAMDSTDHVVFAEGTGFMAGNLVAPASWAGTPGGLSDWVFYQASSSATLSSFAGSQDPNGALVFPSLGMGNAASKGIVYAYMTGTSGSSKALLQVDVTGLLAMTRQGASGDAAHEPQGDPATTKDATTGGLVLQAVVF